TRCRNDRVAWLWLFRLAFPRSNSFGNCLRPGRALDLANPSKLDSQRKKHCSRLEAAPNQLATPADHLHSDGLFLLAGWRRGRRRSGLPIYRIRFHQLDAGAVGIEEVGLS